MLENDCAFVLGVVAAVICYICCEKARWLGFGDALGVLGVHGMGGFIGTHSKEQLGKQLLVAVMRLRFQDADLLGPGCVDHEPRRGDHERPPGHDGDHRLFI